jgi:hypothetical protein
VLLGQSREFGQPVEAVVPGGGVVAAVSGLHLIGDVPEEFETHGETFPAADTTKRL